MTSVAGSPRVVTTPLPQDGSPGQAVGGPALTFDPTEHIYRLAGQRVLSVTQVLKAVGLIDDEWYTEESRIRGSYVHKAITFEEREGLDDASIDERLAGYVAAYRAFVQEARPGACSLLEQQLADPVLRYAGTPDQVRLLFGGFALIDHKTGPAAIWHPLQTAAYDRLVHVADPSVPRLRRFALYLRKDGTYRLQEHTGRNDFKVFQAALAVAHFKEAA